MGLQMNGECERCHAALALDGEAYICVHECTFCSACADALQHVCPNCGGELVRRPRPKMEQVHTSGQAAA